MDDLGLGEPVDRLGQRVVEAVADTADRGLAACLCETFGVADRQVLGPAVAVVDQPHALAGVAIMHRLLQGIEHESGMRRSADPPADDLAGIGVDDESHIDKRLPGGDAGEV